MMKKTLMIYSDGLTSRHGIVRAMHTRRAVIYNAYNN